MNQQAMIFLVLFLLVLGFALYPALMLRLIGATIHGIATVIMDALGLLLAWI